MKLMLSLILPHSLHLLVLLLLLKGIPHPYLLSSSLIEATTTFATLTSFLMEVDINLW